MEELRIIEHCIKGENRAKQQFVEKYSNLIYSAIKTFIKNNYIKVDSEEVKDIYQTAFLKAFENNCELLKKYNPQRKTKFSTWFYVVTINSLRNRFSRNFHLTETIREDIRSNEISAEEKIERTELSLFLNKAINEKLSPEEKIFIKLYINKNLSFETIARIQGIKLDTAYSRKNKIINKLKKSFNKIG